MISQKAKLHNRFDFEIYDTETGETEHAKAENIVLDSMWSYVGTFNYIGVGTGYGELSPSRTTLFSFLAHKSAAHVETVYDTDTTAHVTKKITFSEEEANGVWTEVGIMRLTSNTSFLTHALITDSEGNPITVNKTNTKIITVYATIFAQLLPTAPCEFALGLGHRNAILSTMVGNAPYLEHYKFTGLLRADGSPAFIGVHTSIESGARLGVNQGNAPIRGVIWSTSDMSSIAGGSALPHPLFPKQDFTNIPIGTGDGGATEFDFPVNFVKPGSEKIYVNGVLKTQGTDYTVHYGIRSTETMVFSHQDSSNKALGPVDEIVAIPQPPEPYFDDGAATVYAIEYAYNLGGHSAKYTSSKFELSTDGVTWVAAGSAPTMGGTYVFNGFAPAKYKYLKVQLTPNSSGAYMNSLKIYGTPPVAQKQIKFAAPPASGAVITADFSIEYINKTANFVLDTAMSVTYGEGA